MPGFLETTKRKIREGVDPEPLARIAGRDGAVIVQSDVISPAGAGTGISIFLYELNNTTAIHSVTNVSPVTGSPTSGQIIFDTLQTDDRWGADTIGYNFRYPLRQEDFSAGVSLEGGKTYRVEVLIYTSAWGVIRHDWEYVVLSTYTT